MDRTSFDDVSSPPAVALPTRLVDQNAPSRWVALAIRDFRAAPGLSLAWGGLFSGIGISICLGLTIFDLGSLIPFSVASFFLLAPLLSIGLYDIARRLSRGEPVRLTQCLAAWQRNPSGLSGLGLALMMAFLVWAQAAMLLFLMFFQAPPPNLEDFLHNLLISPNVFNFLFAGTVSGAVIAAVVFAISAISVPVLLTRNVSAERAMATSFQAVRKNAKVMIGWAATLVLLTGTGLLCGFIGLAVTLPLVAYGSWHACEDLME